VGSGAEGILYRGWITTATGLELTVAIKMLQPRHLAMVEQWQARWAEQVELLRSLQLPGVVTVRDGFAGPLPHAQGEPGEGRTLYLVMNWVEGEALDEWVRRRPDRDRLGALKLLLPVAAALDLMHSGRQTGGVPVIHRDVKPANILVTDQGSVLVDFGLIRGLPGGQAQTSLVGTPGYLAPETRSEGRYLPASDAYALGLVAYFLLTGKEPAPDTTAADVARDLAELLEPAGQTLTADRLVGVLHPDPLQRPADLANWVGQLSASSLPDLAAPPAPAAPTRQRAPAQHPHQAGRKRPVNREPATTRPPKRRRHRWLALAGLTLAIAAIAAFQIITRSNTSPGIGSAAGTPPVTAGPATNTPNTSLAAGGAKTAWSVQSTPNPRVSPNSNAFSLQFNTTFGGVSCTSAVQCTAVGSYTTPSGATSTLVETWNGAAWSIQATPTFSGTTLTSVSCVSATACTAVGSYGGAVQATLAEGWNGAIWSIEATPTPTGSSGAVLQSVSCISTSACVAVGFYKEGSVPHPLLEKWNGTRWSAQTSPTANGILFGVSCAAEKACVAVGEGSSQVPLAESWNGTSWSGQTVRSIQSQLQSVSCTSANACIAVGGSSATRWDGSSWSAQTTPYVPGTGEVNLMAVSCGSARTCTAVGSQSSTGLARSPLLETWNGSDWSIQNTPSLNDSDTMVLTGVSCSSAACTAVGARTLSGGDTITLAEQQEGGATSRRDSTGAGR
jgi:serine/threonine protein kinase